MKPTDFIRGTIVCSARSHKTPRIKSVGFRAARTPLAQRSQFTPASLRTVIMNVRFMFECMP